MARQCDDCGSHMGAYEPRKRVEGRMLCPACVASPRGGLVSATAASQGDDHEVLYHITDRHHFALDPEYAPQDNSFAIEDRSGRRGLYLTDSPDRWRANGYHRPYVAEVHVPRGLAEDGRWHGEKFLPAEHYDKASVPRVMPFDEHQRERWGGTGTIEEGLGSPASTPSGKDVRDFTPDEHTEHLRRFRDYAHDVQNWGWNEFNDQHEHVGTDETDDQGMPVRRDRNGNVMASGRYAKRVRKQSSWSQARHPDPIIHTPGRRPPRPLQTGDTLLWETGSSEPITGHADSLLMTPSGIKHRGPIEGDHSRTIFATDPDLESEVDSIGSPDAEEYLRSNPTGPTKYSRRKSLPKTQKCEYCKDPATKRLLWAEGMGYIPTCDAHESDGRHQIEVTNKDEVVGVKPIDKAASTRKVAHDSGDGMTIYHCPFCGSGQVIARSDRSIECQFCHTSFTVQVQPEFSNFPQTINGVPVQVPGMPGQIGGPEPVPGEEPMPGEDPMDPNAPVDPDDLGEDGSEPPEGDGEEDDAPPWAKESMMTPSGVRVSGEDFVNHVAFAITPDRGRTASLVRARRRAGR